MPRLQMLPSDPVLTQRVKSIVPAAEYEARRLASASLFEELRSLAKDGQSFPIFFELGREIFNQEVKRRIILYRY